MKIVLMNMCMIHDLTTDNVLVLDKKIKEGWEGLTFPGGHIEKGESLIESCIREIKEETNLDICDLVLKGSVEWYIMDEHERHIGLLFYTNSYSGELVENNREGDLEWMNLEKFLAMNNKSKSMDDIMKVYMGQSKEVTFYFKGDNLEKIVHL